MRKVAVLTVVLFCVLSLGMPVEASTWTIPGIVNVSGLNNTHFVSDLAVTNPGSASAVVTLVFLPTGLPDKQVTLGAGQTVVYRNVLDQLWGATLAGAVQVSADSALVLRARVYNNASVGTYGVALPVFAEEDLLAAGNTGHSLWVSQSADGATGYRTNIAVVFPDPTGGEAKVIIYDADGNKIASKNYALDAAGFQQIGVGAIAGAVPIGRAEIQVIRGPAAGYSVVNDNITGDSSLFTFDELPVGWQDVLINGVARANGRNGTFFRTDGRFYNPSSQDATVTVSFHASGDSNASPATASFTLPAGKIRDVVDVLDTLLGLPVGSAGALRFRSAGPIGILCRTSNVDPAGITPGTFGAGQKPAQLLSFLMSADAGAVVTGIRQNAAFRTNVGFAAGEAGAAYALTLKAAAGNVVATGSGSLGPFGWTQPSVQDLFPGVPIPDDATLLVKVTSGSVDVFDSSIDNTSGDSVMTRIAPLPADIPSSATIGPLGGSIRSDDGILTLRVPAGALNTPTPMSIGTTTNDAPEARGSGYGVSPAGLSFAKPAVLGLRYGAGGVTADEIGGVALASLTGAGWASLTGGNIDTSSRSLLIRIQSTSPADAPAAAHGARAALAPPAPSLLGASGVALVRVPGWLPTDGKLPLKVEWRTLPSSAGFEYKYEYIGAALGAVTVSWSTLNIGLLDRYDLPQPTYTAPNKIENVSTVASGSATVRQNNKVLGEVPFSFHVIRRNWRLDVFYFLHITCENSDVSVELGGNGATTYQTFAFTDNLTFQPKVASPPAAVTIPTVTSCKGCTISITSPPGPLTLSRPEGFFFGSIPGFILNGQTSQTNGLPGYTATACPSLWDYGFVAGVDINLPVFLAPHGSLYWFLSDNPLLAHSDLRGGIVVQYEWRSVDGDLPPP